MYGMNLLFLDFVPISTGKALLISFLKNLPSYPVSVLDFSKDITKPEAPYERFRMSHGY